MSQFFQKIENYSLLLQILWEWRKNKLILCLRGTDLLFYKRWREFDHEMPAIDAAALTTTRAAGRQHCKASGFIICRTGSSHGLQLLHLDTFSVHTCNQDNLVVHAICPPNKSKTGLAGYFCFKKLMRICRSRHKTEGSAAYQFSGNIYMSKQ